MAKTVEERIAVLERITAQVDPELTLQQAIDRYGADNLELRSLMHQEKNFTLLADRYIARDFSVFGAIRNRVRYRYAVLKARLAQQRVVEQTASADYAAWSAAEATAVSQDVPA